MMKMIKREIAMKRNYLSLILAVATAASIVSCNKKEIVDPNDGLQKVNFTLSGKIDPSLTRTYIEESGDTYLAHWSSESDEHIGLFFDDVVKDLESVTFDALDISNDIATFYGSAEVTLGEHTIHPFYPASAFNKTYNPGQNESQGKIGLTLNRVQYPVLGSFDPAADILIGKDQDITVNDADEVMVENIVFTRPMAVLRLHLVAKNNQAKAYGESVTSVEMEVLGQTSNFALTGNLAYTPDNDAISWNTNNASVKAVFDSEHGNVGNASIDTDADLNSVYLVVNPAMISSGTIKFTIETDDYSGINAISRTVTVPEGGMEFLAGKVNEINLTIRDKDVPEIVTDTRILVEGFDNVTTNKTQPEASQTGVFGTGVTSSLEYTYSTGNTNIRFNNNGQANDNPYLYINEANQFFTMSNIAVSNQTWLAFTAKVKNTGILTINYKESSATTWKVAGTITGGSSFTETTVNFSVASTVTSIDLQLVGSAVLLVDDIVLEIGTAPAHNLAVDNVTKTLGSVANSTVTIDVTSNYSWTASITEGSGFTITPSAGGPDGSIIVTALNNGPSTESEIGQLTITDGSDDVVVHIRQSAYVESSTTYNKITSLADLTNGDYVIVATSGSKNYAIPQNPTVNSGKITGTEVIISDDKISESAASGLVWTITKSGNYYTVSDGSKYLYHSNGGNSGTNLAYGTSTSYPWSISVLSSTYGSFKFAGVNGSTVKDRGLLYSVDNSVFGGYALSNAGEKYPGIDLYKKTTSGPITYQISLGTIINGSVERSVESAVEGASVTLTASANPNYAFSSWNITGITLTEAQKTANPLTINMPGNDITVGANFEYDGPGTIITINFAEANQRPEDFPTSSGGKLYNLNTYTIAGYSFSFLGTSDGGYYWPHADTNNQKYLIIGKSGAYILFPAIEGQKLTNVKFTTGASASTNVIVDIYSADGATSIYGNTNKLGQATSYDWSLTNTDNNAGYQFRVTNAYNAQLTSLELTYE